MSGEQSHDTFYEEYEVFSRKKDTTPLQYQFSLLAPNHDMAMTMAKENFFRREIPNDIWIVKRSDIRKMTQNEKEAMQRLDKPYRETKGYTDLVQRWRNFRNAYEEKEGEKA
ncbi:MAG TPA: 1,2-phenylacetyl-CoA epoxidase subunit PaaB [Bacillales bacterium]|nr:1,2-phenylacetyl-CoA epoxidase subunit PaaB [Bacillales bacterium]